MAALLWGRTGRGYAVAARLSFAIDEAGTGSVALSEEGLQPGLPGLSTRLTGLSTTPEFWGSHNVCNARPHVCEPDRGCTPPDRLPGPPWASLPLSEATTSAYADL